MSDYVKEILISEEEIRERVKELGAEITEDYEGEEILVIGILKGSVIFMSELVQRIGKPVKMDFMDVSSYGTKSVSTGEIEIIKDIEYSIKDKNILIVEDIIDTGYTLNYLVKDLEERGAKSVKICTFLDKIDRREVDIPIDYIGYEVPDEFIVGYGLDYAEMYRNLPYVAALKEEVYKD